MFVGRLGAAELAGASLAVALFNVLLALGIGLTTAVGPIIAYDIGRQEKRAVISKTISQGVIIAAIYALISLYIAWETNKILLFLGQDPQTAMIADRYMHTYGWSLVPALMFDIMRYAASALGQPSASLWVTMFSIAVSVIITPILAHGFGPIPALGLEGVGIAGTIANTLMFVGIVIIFRIDPILRRQGFRFARVWPNMRLLREMFRLGWPIAIALVTEYGIFDGLALVMGLFGPNTLAATAIVVQLVSFSYMIPLSVSQATMIKVGIAAGRGDKTGISSAGWSGIALGVCCMIVVAMIYWFVPDPLIQLFLDTSDPNVTDVRDLAVHFMVVAGFFQIIDGIQVTGTGALRGLKDTRIPMIFVTGGLWGVGMPLGFFLAFPGGMKGTGVWTGLAVALTVISVLILVRWRALQKAYNPQARAEGDSPMTEEEIKRTLMH